MAYIDGEDTQGGLFTAIDGDLTPFFKLLIKIKMHLVPL